MHNSSVRHQSSRAFSFVLLLLGASACSLDVGPNQSNCQVAGQTIPGAALGLTVLIQLPQSCPFETPPGGQFVAFAATFIHSDLNIAGGSYLRHFVYNRNNVQLEPDRIRTSQWRESVRNQVISNVVDEYLAGSGGTGLGDPTTMRDYWRTETDVVGASGGLEVLGATALLTYYNVRYAAIDQSVFFPNPYDQVSLTASAPGWVAEPRRYTWWRDGVFIGEMSQQISVVSGGPSESVNYEVVVTGANQEQVRGIRTVTSREHACPDPNQIICQ